MPKRVIDFDAMWGSDKIAACAEWAQTEYAWLYGLADPSGCFELTNLRVIWGRVAAIRRNLTIERLEQVFGEFQDKGLLFVWEQDGKRYGHWTGSDVPGRLPPPSWRMRLERLAPPVPKQLLAEYMSRFARGRASSPGGGFLAGGREEEDCKSKSSNLKCASPAVAMDAGSEHLRGPANPATEGQFQNKLRSGISNLRRDERTGVNTVSFDGVGRWDGAAGGDCRVVDGPGEIDGAAGQRRGRCSGEWSGLKDGVEEAHAQDLGLEWNWERNGKRVGGGGDATAGQAADAADVPPNLFSDLNSKIISNAKATATMSAAAEQNANARATAIPNAKALLDSNSPENITSRIYEKSIENGTTNVNAAALTDENGSSGCSKDPNVRAHWSENRESAANVNSVAAANLGEDGRFGPVSECRKPGNDIAESTARDKANGAESKGGSKTEWGGARSAAAYAPSGNAYRDKVELLARELRVGQGPSSLGPVRVKPEALERIRLRNAGRDGSRSP
ncbi:MAG: hypothetical protein LAO08_19530 [Acidobacteriia bacterium]|nr:hypothetical protein [Terriglobia bacterium]